MSYLAHDAILVHVGDRLAAQPYLPDIDAFRASMPAVLHPLVVGPIRDAYEVGMTYLFAPDGSNEGWPESITADDWRHRFVELFAFTHPDGSSPFDVVHVRFGGDFGKDQGATVRVVRPAPATPETR